MTDHLYENRPRAEREQSICVVGLGYIGLPTASLLATRGYRVLGVDVVARVVDTINSGGIHIVEPDLDVLVQAAVRSGRLRASQDPEPSDVFVIAVPTPFRENREPNLEYVRQATESIAPHLAKGNLVVLESTSPPGTTEEVAMILEGRTGMKVGVDFHAAHCPERVLPGQILRELVSNDRVVGGVTPECAEVARVLYESFVNGKVLVTDARTAEMTKLVENTYRDINIAFANELSMLCDSLGVDVWDVIRLANRHPRVNVLSPGPGVGGHCIAVDPWFLVHADPDITRLIRTAREVNDAKPHFVADKVLEAARRSKDAKVAVLGLTYKADVDDFRESPSLDIARGLAAELGDRVRAHDPYADREAQGAKWGLTLSADAGELVDWADIVVLLVGHSAYGFLREADLTGKTVMDVVNYLGQS